MTLINIYYMRDYSKQCFEIMYYKKSKEIVVFQCHHNSGNLLMKLSISHLVSTNNSNILKFISIPK